MAVLPDPNAQRRQLAQPQGGMMAVPAIGADVAAAQGQLVQQIGRIGEGIIEDRNRFEFAKARSEWMTGQINLQNELENSDDWRSAPQRYADGIKALRERVGGTLGGRGRAQFDLLAGEDEARGLAAANRFVRQRQRQQDGADIVALMDANRDTYLRAPTDQVREEIRRTTLDAINGAIETGALTPEQGYNMRSRWAESAATGRLSLMPPAERRRALTARPAPAEYGAIVDQAAAAAGVSPELVTRVIQTESNWNPAAESSTGRIGLGQFDEETAARYGVRDRTDPAQSIHGVAVAMADKKRMLTTILGRAPTEAEIYLTYQQGDGGGPALLSNPDANAVDVLEPLYPSRAIAEQAITANGGRADMTAGEFTRMWAARFGGATDTVAPITGTDLDEIPLDRRAQLLEATDRELERDRAVWRQQISTQYDDTLAYLSAGGDPAKIPPDMSRDSLALAYGPEEGARRYAALATATGVANDTREIATASPERIKEIVADRLPTGPGGFRSEAADIKTLTDALQIRQKALATDPASWLVQNDTKVAGAYAEALTGRGSWDAVATQMDATFDQIGVPARDRRLLTKADAERLAQDVMTGQAGDVAANFDALRGSMSPATFDRVYADMVQLGKLPIEAQVVTEISQDNGIAKQTYADAMKLGHDAVVKALPNQGKDFGKIEDEVYTALTPFRLSLGASADSANMYASRAKAVALLAAQYIASGRETDLATAARRAADDVVNWAYDFTSEGWRVPKRAGGESMTDDVEDIADRLQGDLKSGDFYIYPADEVWLSDPSRAAVVPERQREGAPVRRPGEFRAADVARRSVEAEAARPATIQDAYANAPKAWVNIPNGDSGMVLIFTETGDAVLRADGSPVTFRFDEVMHSPDGGYLSPTALPAVR